jgi:hypothetical protein
MFTFKLDGPRRENIKWTPISMSLNPQKVIHHPLNEKSIGDKTFKFQCPSFKEHNRESFSVDGLQMQLFRELELLTRNY